MDNKQRTGIFAATFVAMLLTFAPFAMAAPSKITGFQTLDKEVASLGEPAGITPDSPIYGIKRFWESVQVTFAGGDVAKAKLKYRFAEVRLAEASEMLKKNKAELVEKAMKEYEAKLSEANDDAEKAVAAGKNIDEIVSLSSNKTSKHLAVLNRLLEKVPESARPAIENAIQASANENYKIVIRDAKKGKKIISTLRSKLKDEGLREDLIIKAKQRLNVSDTIKATIGETEIKVIADVGDEYLRLVVDSTDKAAAISQIAQRLNITEEKVSSLIEWKVLKTADEAKANLEEAKSDVADLEKKIADNSKKMTAAFKKSLAKSVDVIKDHVAKGERYLLDKKYDSAWAQANAASKKVESAEKKIDKYLDKITKKESTEELEKEEETTTTTAQATTTTAATTTTSGATTTTA